MKIRYSGWVVFLLLMSLVEHAAGQNENIPIGAWRMHVSYQDIRSITLGENEVFAASSAGVFGYDIASQELSFYNKLNGLSHAGIVEIEYAINEDALLVAYDNGTFDVIDNELTVLNFDPLRNTVLTGDRGINHITIGNGVAYLSTDYGVLVFDLVRNEIKETWRDLGREGQTLRITSSAIFNGSILLSTARGLMRGDLSKNLLDFNQWSRFDEDEFDTSVAFVAVADDKPYAFIDGDGIYQYDGVVWSKSDVLPGASFSYAGTSGNVIMVAENGNVWALNASGTVDRKETGSIGVVNDIAIDAAGKTWLASRMNGLMRETSGQFVSIVPNGPASNEIYKLEKVNARVYALERAFNSDYSPRMNDGSISIFENGTWTPTEYPARDITAVSFGLDNAEYLSSFGFGVIKTHNGNAITFDETNSTLINTDPPQRRVMVTDLEHSASGLWVANYDSPVPLHLYNGESWQSFTPEVNGVRYAIDLEDDLEGNIWIIPNPELSSGLIVFNPEGNKIVQLLNVDGEGELPSNKVYSMEMDLDGYMWVGTDEGVAYFFDEESDAVKPIYENRFLLRDDKVQAIAVDGGNRKWMGTERGVWLFSDNGEKLIKNFTTANSPLPSDNILDIEINPFNGEVFIATEKGLVSFRSDATAGKESFSSSIVVYPNPVTNQYTGSVGFTGLATDAIIKITDVSGKLIWQTQANGGTASWNVQDYRGTRVKTGVFLVFAILPDGSESVVGKIAVIN